MYPGRHHQGRAQGGGGRVRRRSVLRVTMPHWDVSRVTDMSFLFQGKTQFNVDISQWEMSQVTDCEWYVPWRLQLPPGTSGAGPWRPERTRRGCSRAPTPGSPRCTRADGSDTTDGPPAAWVCIRLCLEERARPYRDWCVACGAGKYNGPDDDPVARCRHRCDAFVDT